VYGVAQSDAQDRSSQETDVQTQSAGRQSVYERRYPENADKKTKKTKLGQPKMCIGTVEQWQGDDSVCSPRRS